MLVNMPLLHQHENAEHCEQTLRFDLYVVGGKKLLLILQIKVQILFVTNFLTLCTCVLWYLK